MKPAPAPTREQMVGMTYMQFLILGLLSEQASDLFTILRMDRTLYRQRVKMLSRRLSGCVRTFNAAVEGSIYDTVFSGSGNSVDDLRDTTDGEVNDYRSRLRHDEQMLLYAVEAPHLRLGLPHPHATSRLLVLDTTCHAALGVSDKLSRIVPSGHPYRSTVATVRAQYEAMRSAVRSLCDELHVWDLNDSFTPREWEGIRRAIEIYTRNMVAL